MRSVQPVRTENGNETFGTDRGRLFVYSNVDANILVYSQIGRSQISKNRKIRFDIRTKGNTRHCNSRSTVNRRSVRTSPVSAIALFRIEYIARANWYRKRNVRRKFNDTKHNSGGEEGGEPLWNASNTNGPVTTKRLNCLEFVGNIIIFFVFFLHV